MLRAHDSPIASLRADVGMTRRWSALTEGVLDAEQRTFWDFVASGNRQVPSVDEEGHLVGPYDVLLRVPRLGERVAALGVQLRDVALPERLRVLAILTVASRWQSEFEWWAWEPVARRSGLGARLIAALQDGVQPEFEHDDEALVYTAAGQLVTSGAMDDTTFAEAQDCLGEAGLVELVVLVGYYALIAVLMNTFQIPLPRGEPYVWAR
jgi:4-carboxymuconolactone decarboxylase